jgi:hypothetical protein
MGVEAEPARRLWTTERLALWIPLALGVALRLRGLATFPLEQDELYTRIESTMLLRSPLVPGIEARPLYFLFHHFWLALWPSDSALVSRLPALLFGILGLVVTHRLAREVSGTTAAAVATVLAAVSPWHLYASGMARYWSLVYLLETGFAYALWRAYRTDAKRQYLAALVLLVAGTLTHPSFLFPAVGVAAGLILVDPERRRRLIWPSRAAWSWLWLPFAGVLAIYYGTLVVASGTSAVRNFGALRPDAIARLIPAVVQWVTPALLVAAGAWALVVVVTGAGLRRRWAGIALGAMVMGVFLLGLSGVFTNAYADYAIGVLPFVFVSCGVLVAEVRTVDSSASWTVQAVMTGALVASVAPSTVSHLMDGTRHDFRPALARARAMDSRRLVVAWPIVVARRYARDLDLVELKPRAAYLDSLLTARDSFWLILPLQRYGVVGDAGGILAIWAVRHCRLDLATELPRFDYRRYRVELHACS